MTEIGVERLGAGHGKEDSAERNQPNVTVAAEKRDCMQRIECREYAWVLSDLAETGDRDGDEPDRVTGPKNARCSPCRATAP